MDSRNEGKFEPHNGHTLRVKGLVRSSVAGKAGELGRKRQVLAIQEAIRDSVPGPVDLEIIACNARGQGLNGGAFG